jgi:hypothetical protein
MKRLVPFLLIVAAILIVVYATYATDTFPCGTFYYIDLGNPPSDAVVDTLAARYNYGVAFHEIGAHAESVIVHNPLFKWYVPNSGTDNYRGGDDDQKLLALEAELGYDYEACYLHYAESTVVVLEGDTVRLSAGDRVPVFYPDQSRCLLNFMADSCNQMHMRSLLRTTTLVCFTDIDTLFPDGIFLTNSGYKCVEFGDGDSVLYGGGVAEDADSSDIDSAEFQTWWWGKYQTFVKLMTDTLTAVSKELVADVGDEWTDDYYAGDPWDMAPILCVSGEYSTVTDYGLNLVDTVFDNVDAAEGNDVEMWYAPEPTTALGTEFIEIEDSKMYNLAFYLATKEAYSIWYSNGEDDPGSASWENRTWCEGFRLVFDNIGDSKAAPYIYAQGTDPAGNHYHVWARNYTKGLVLVRMRGASDEGIGEDTGVSVRLPNGGYTEVTCDGYSSLSGQPTITMRNGSAAVFVRLSAAGIAP